MNRACAHPSQGMTRAEGGFALIAVLMVLGVLLALLGPFLFSMGQESNAAEDEAGQREVRTLADGGRQVLLARLGQTHGSSDLTPNYDDVTELEIRYDTTEDESSLGPRRVLTAESIDLQGRIHAPTCPQMVWANLLGLVGVLRAPLKIDQTQQMAVSNISRFPDSGYVWIGTELIHYGRKSAGGLEDLERGVKWTEGPPDPYGPPHDHDAYAFVFDARVRELVTRPFERDESRASWNGWRAFEEMLEVSRAGFGDLTMDELEPIRLLLAFDGARPHGASLGKAERVFSALVPGETHVVVVRDPMSFPPGTVVRIRVQDAVEWALVVDDPRKLSRGLSSSASVGSSPGRLVLHRVTQLLAGEDEAIIEPLLPLPLNINTASAAALTGVFQNIRGAGSGWSMMVSPEGRHLRMQEPLAGGRAKQLSEHLVGLRGPTEDEDWPHPFTGVQDLLERGLLPMREAGIIGEAALDFVYSVMLNGLDSRNAQASIPVAFESSGLVRYRVATALLSGGGRTLAREERVGVALPQPSRGVDKVYASQNRFDEATRSDRSRPFWTTWPENTTVHSAHPIAGGSRSSSEPPSLSRAHLAPVSSGGKKARFPSEDAEASRVTLGVAQPPLIGIGNAVYGFGGTAHPEGWDVRALGPYRDIQVALPGSVNAKNVEKILKRVERSGLIPMSEGPGGLGMAFGIGFWAKPRGLQDQVLFDLAGRDGSPAQNRITLALEGAQVVLRVWDVAGLDPEPGEDNPEETCLKWTMPIQDNGIVGDVWSHFGFELAGGTPDGICVFTDGAAKGKPWYMSHLLGALGEVDLTQLTNNRQRQRALNPTLGVEDSEGLPRAGVYIVGNELFEVTENQNGALATSRRDSRGGRGARDSGIPIAVLQGKADASSAKLPPHPANAAMRLYGYSNPILEQYHMLPGEGQLASGSLKAWGVARVVDPREPIQVGRVSLGKGIDEKFTGPIQLAAPIVDAEPSGGGIPGFDRGGGYALLIQRGITVRDMGQNLIDYAGGCEVIRYSAFDGTQLTIESRALTLPPDLNGGGDASWLRAEPSKFVTEWEKRGRTDPNSLPQLFTFCVPISVAVSGLTLLDPVSQDHSDWIQIRPNDEQRTEWVRYDYVDASRNWVCRTRRRAVWRLFWELTRNRMTAEVTGPPRNPIVRLDFEAGPVNWEQPPQDDPKGEIGSIDDFEVGDNLPHWIARRRFAFRGDMATGTSSHELTGGLVTPVFRTAVGRLRLGRPGRGDRIASVTGSDGDDLPSVEWNRITWAVRQWVEPADQDDDEANRGSNQQDRPDQDENADRDPRGPVCNLVALAQGALTPLIGKKLVTDTRVLDRIVKFPSGELPIRLAERATVGGDEGGAAGGQPLNGLIDDIQGFWGLHHNLASGGRDSEILGLVAVPCVESARSIAFVPSRGQRIRLGGVLQNGGLVLIGGEVIGVATLDATGFLVVAENGRGMLGTEPRAHDVGERVQFISSRPAGALSSSMSASQSAILVANPGRLPRYQGTVLVNEELLHYCWTRGQMLEMPPHAVANQGVFRGRYGTAAAGHGSGSLAIAWPIRYWDRYAERADDPELAYLGISTEAANLFVTELLWEEEIPDPSLDLILLARADDRVPWSADAEKTWGLWRFDSPLKKNSTMGRKIGAQASRWDFRFHVIYKSGAFNPQLFNATGWKRTPSVKAFAYTYQSATSVLREEVTLR